MIRSCHEETTIAERAPSLTTQHGDVDVAAPIDPQARIAHIHLNVADLDRAIAFYHTALGFAVSVRYGNAQAFLAAGTYPHLLGLRAVRAADGPAPARSCGLYHYGLLFPTQQALVQAVRRVRADGVAITDAADYGVGLAIYIDDPDGNTIELCWERPAAPAGWHAR